MRFALVSVLAVVALGACGQQGGADAGGEATSGAAQSATMGSFPSLTGTSYRLEANVTHTDGTVFPVVMQRDGLKMRMEFTVDGGSAAIVSDQATGETLIFINAGGRPMAVREGSAGDQRFSDPTADWQGDLAQKAARTGSCTVAGETGGVWASSEAGKTQTACVTDDGVILSATEDGRTIWQTTAVQRGPQPASAFEAPPGLQILDAGNVLDQLRRRAGQ